MRTNTQISSSKRPRSSGWLNYLILAAAAIAWSSWEVSVILTDLGGSIGFHPALLFAIPISMLVFTLGLIQIFVCRSVAQSILILLAAVSIFLPLYFNFSISSYAWTKATLASAERNHTAIESTNFTGAEFDYVPYKDHPRMVPINGFDWIDPTPKYPSANSKYLGFSVQGVPHVYLYPIRNGCRGIALIKDKSFVARAKDTRYFQASDSDWYFWISP